MNKIVTLSLVGFTALGLGIPRASAWWLFDCNHCCAKICCRQYNAFSPFCCCAPGGGYFPAGYACGGSPACGYPGAQGYVSELPGPETTGAPGTNGTETPPANNGSNPSSSVAAPGQNTQPVPPGAVPHPLPPWGAGAANPTAPGAYPGSSVYGMPSNNSGFPVYGPANGSPSYYPSYPSFGPANGSPSSYPSYPGYGPAAGFGRY